MGSEILTVCLWGLSALPGRSQRGSPLRQSHEGRLSVPAVPGHCPQQRGVGADGAASPSVPGGGEQLLPRGGAVEVRHRQVCTQGGHCPCPLCTLSALYQPDAPQGTRVSLSQAELLP